MAWSPDVGSPSRSATRRFRTGQDIKALYWLASSIDNYKSVEPPTMRHQTLAPSIVGLLVFLCTTEGAPSSPVDQTNALKSGVSATRAKVDVPAAASGDPGAAPSSSDNAAQCRAEQAQHNAQCFTALLNAIGPHDDRKIAQRADESWPIFDRTRAVIDTVCAVCVEVAWSCLPCFNLEYMRLTNQTRENPAADSAGRDSNDWDHLCDVDLRDMQRVRSFRLVFSGDNTETWRLIIEAMMDSPVWAKTGYDTFDFADDGTGIMKSTSNNENPSLAIALLQSFGFKNDIQHSADDPTNYDLTLTAPTLHELETAVSGDSSDPPPADWSRTSLSSPSTQESISRENMRQRRCADRLK